MEYRTQPIINQVVIPVGRVAAARDSVRISCDKVPSLAGNMFVDQEIAEKKVSDFTVSVGLTENGDTRKLVSESKWLRKDHMKNRPTFSTPNREIDLSAAQNVAQNPFRQLDKQKPKTHISKDRHTSRSANFTNNRFVKSNVKRKKPAKARSLGAERKVQFKNDTDEDTVVLVRSRSLKSDLQGCEQPPSIHEETGCFAEATDFLSSTAFGHEITGCFAERKSLRSPSDINTHRLTGDIIARPPSNTDHQRTGCFTDVRVCFARKIPDKCEITETAEPASKKIDSGSEEIDQTTVETDQKAAETPNIQSMHNNDAQFDSRTEVYDQKSAENPKLKSIRPQTQKLHDGPCPPTPQKVIDRIFSSCM